jgi:EAL domain-containing protein (putative c-di-GMP-specific phosphodiesterase class I)
MEHETDLRHLTIRNVEGRIPNERVAHQLYGSRGKPTDPTPAHLVGRPPRIRSSGRRADAEFLACEQPQLQASLAEAIYASALQVHFQGQFDVVTGDGVGVEALARWRRPDGRRISPDVFIPVAERAGLIGGLGAWMLHQACETVVAWPIAGRTPPTLSINVSSHQINETFGASLASIIALTGFPADRLELEITESTLVSNFAQAIKCLHRWRALGVHIAIDDFGTGYSSLNYLARLPVDRLKLDKTFVQRMVHDRKTAAIVRSLLAMGKEIGVTVLAEGVESERQLHFLQTSGCRLAQGYLFSKPVPSAEAQTILSTAWGERSKAASRRDQLHLRELHAF